MKGFALKLGKAVSFLPMFPADFQARALAVNSRGQIVGSSNGSASPSRAVLWERGRIHDLNETITPESGWSLLTEAKAINKQGAIAGYGFATNGLTASCSYL